MIGLKRGTVELVPHQEEWDRNAKAVITVLKQILGNVAVDIQHVGSTAIPSISAKPIIDIAVGLRDLEDIYAYMDTLKWHGFVYRREDITGQMLFVMGDFESDTRTHHIHVTKWGEAEWKNYVNFRDYLNAYPEKAAAYDDDKRKLAKQFSNDRKGYTAGKKEIIGQLLKEASIWRV